ncbi:helix-turn-helix domain-containing protein [Nocardiopsis sp. NPDC006198]|uniref:helix-turn-helix domain-containing protein n=1 Tax=Nocardiopsis sp. NPDC006198 TaxID=3154472 RepID=UPI0033B6F885
MPDLLPLHQAARSVGMDERRAVELINSGDLACYVAPRRLQELLRRPPARALPRWLSAAQTREAVAPGYHLDDVRALVRTTLAESGATLYDRDEVLALPRAYPPGEAAHLLGITTDAVRRLARNGRLDHIYVPGRRCWLYPADQVDAQAEALWMKRTYTAGQARERLKVPGEKFAELAPQLAGRRWPNQPYIRYPRSVVDALARRRTEQGSG